jgi:hypothetical protein
MPESLIFILFVIALLIAARIFLKPEVRPPVAPEDSDTRPDLAWWHHRRPW